MSVIQKATRNAVKLRAAFCGITGGGKTYSALRVATGLLQSVPLVGNANPNKNRILVLDTEKGRSSLYAKRFDEDEEGFDFDMIEMGDHNPKEYVKYIQLGEKEGYGAIVIDSLSHAWMGRNGALEQVDKAATRSQSNNTFTAWRDVTPLHNQLVDSIIRSDCHVIATMRSEMDYVLEADKNGKMAPKKIGLKPVQRSGVEYEFDLICDFDHRNNMVVSKTRFNELRDVVKNRVDESFGQQIAECVWANGRQANGAGRVGSANKLTAHRPAGLATQEQLNEFNAMLEKLDWPPSKISGRLGQLGVSKVDSLTEEQMRRELRELEGALAKKRQEEYENGQADRVEQAKQNTRAFAEELKDVDVAQFSGQSQSAQMNQPARTDVGTTAAHDSKVAESTHASESTNPIESIATTEFQLAAYYRYCELLKFGPEQRKTILDRRNVIRAEELTAAQMDEILGKLYPKVEPLLNPIKPTEAQIEAYVNRPQSLPDQGPVPTKEEVLNDPANFTGRQGEAARRDESEPVTFSQAATNETNSESKSESNSRSANSADDFEFSQIDTPVKQSKPTRKPPASRREPAMVPSGDLDED